MNYQFFSVTTVFITIRHSETISEKNVSLKHWGVSAGMEEILKDRNEFGTKWPVNLG